MVLHRNEAASFAQVRPNCQGLQPVVEDKLLHCTRQRASVYVLRSTMPCYHASVRAPACARKHIGAFGCAWDG
eukprot:6980455-Alexandrium_andersonii.AAC.1